MRKNSFQRCVWSIVLGLGLFAMASCNDDNNDSGSNADNGEIIPENGTILTGTITSGQTVILREGRSFQLSGGYTVNSGATLRIEPGVTITAVRDETPDYILIEQGGYIDAQGTANSPIIMTANIGSDELRTAGWGGIHICGYARTNRGAGTHSEIGNSPYGGNDDNDNSGILRYVRLEYTGFALDADHEANGLSLYGVGRGTTIDHIAIYKGGDDGIEFFGGSVNLKYAVVIDASDDSYDWTEGWNGYAQFLVADQRGTTGDNGDCLMECDNNGDNAAATPVAHPILSNLTLIGNNSSVSTRGIRLRAGTQAEIYNALIIGKDRSITIETTETSDALANGTSKLSDILCSGIFYNHDDTELSFTEEMFLTNNNEINVNDITFSNGFVGTVAGGTDPTTLGSFFEAASYKGAVEAGATWIEGNWIRR